ncbi:hypothetical protein D3C80_1895340 [compost metagenome]
MRFADWLHPYDILSIHSLLNRDMGHSRGRGRPVPVFNVGRCPDYIAWLYDSFLTAHLLNPANACGDYQRLAFGMCVPSRSSPRLECHRTRRNSRGFTRSEKRVDPCVADEIAWSPHQ